VIELAGIVLIGAAGLVAIGVLVYMLADLLGGNLHDDHFDAD
jgi:hypothetical protein